MTNCPDDDMAQLLAAIQTDEAGGLALADRLIDAYPADARLQFLRGSVLVGNGRSIEGHAALSRAVELAPDFALARFQLGFFELTSGEADRALASWEPLGSLPQDSSLSLFVAGLTHLIHDRFADAISALRQGMEANDDNPPLNRDMQLIVEQCARLLEEGGAPAEPVEEASATSLLLGQLGGGTVH